MGIAFPTPTLTEVTACGIPTVFIGTMNGLTIVATLHEIRAHPIYAEWFSKLIVELKRLNIDPDVRVIEVTKLSDVVCRATA